MSSKEKVHSHGKIQVSNTLGNGITTGCMVKAIWSIQMVKSTLGILKMICVMAKVFINSAMKENMREVGSEVSSMGSGFTRIEIAHIGKDSGKMVREYSGLIK